MKTAKLSLLLLLISFLHSCDPKEDNSVPNNSNDVFSENFGANVLRDFIGQIVDTNNNPVPNAEVKIGNITVQSDVNGVFMAHNALVHQRFAYITVKKAGFIDGSRTMVPTNGKNNVKIMLLPSTPIQSIASGVASEVTLASGTKVAFDGAFEDENGNAYSGDVSVSMFHLESSNENIDAL